MKDQDTFINYINDHYQEVRNTLNILCNQRNLKLDEDIFHEAILRCYNAIAKKGTLNDKSPYGITSYLLRSYFNLVTEVHRSACYSKRDLNYSDENISTLYEDWYNCEHTSEKEKIVNDLFKDFATLYIMMLVEQYFDSDSFYLFKLKELVPLMTYKKLAERTKIKGARQKVLAVKKWLKENVTKEMIRKEFFSIYGDLI